MPYFYKCKQCDIRGSGEKFTNNNGVVCCDQCDHPVKEVFVPETTPHEQTPPTPSFVLVQFKSFAPVILSAENVEKYICETIQKLYKEDCPEKWLSFKIQSVVLNDTGSEDGRHNFEVESCPCIFGSGESGRSFSITNKLTLRRSVLDIGFSDFLDIVRESVPF